MEQSSPSNLLPGERILWQGQPTENSIFRPVELLLIPFSALWGGFALFWNVSVWATDAPLSFKLFGLPFLIIGAYMVLGRFFVELWMRKKLRYTVTNRRIMIHKDGRANFRSLDIARLPSLEVHEKSDGSGTIRFDRSNNWMAGGGLGIWQPSLDSSPQFIGIKNVSSVWQLIESQSAN